MRVAVVGGGISGLVAALELSGGGADVDLFEAGTIGGSLRGVKLSALPLGEPGSLPELTVDVGAEASLARRPEVPDLLASLGLGAVHPDSRERSQVWTGEALRPIPRGIMGVPSEPVEAEALLGSPLAERATAPLTEDTTVASFVESRLGETLVDLLVDPLLGGVYASDAHTLSLRATVPPLWEAARAGNSLLALAAALPASSAPVFVAPRGGMSALVPALRSAAESAGTRIHEHASVTDLRREARGWAVELAGSRGDTFDGVLLATPAWATGALLERMLSAGRWLADLPHATSALVTAVLDVGDAPLQGSGFLVPPSLARTIKASTFSSRKWPWIADQLPRGHEVVRMSVGRLGATAALHQDDEALTAAALEDFRHISGRDARFVAGGVQRWDRALPQYLPGHVDRLAEFDSATAALPGLAVAGNAFEGVGVPACVARARRASRGLLSDLGRPG